MSVLVLQRYLAVGAILLVIGLIGFMTRRNLIVMFYPRSLMFQGIAVEFHRVWALSHGGGVFSWAGVCDFSAGDRGGRGVAGTGVGVLLFRRKNTLDADAWRELKG